MAKINFLSTGDLIIETGTSLNVGSCGSLIIETESGGSGLSGSIDTSWQVQAASYQDTSWNLQAASYQDTSWQIQAASSRDTSWGVQTASYQATSWNIQTLASRDASWEIETAGLLYGNLSSAWRIQAASSRDTSWGVQAASYQATSWSIQTLSSWDTSWNIQIASSRDTAWRVLTAGLQSISWVLDGTLVTYAGELELQWKVGNYGSWRVSSEEQELWRRSRAVELVPSPFILDTDILFDDILLTEDTTMGYRVEEVIETGSNVWTSSGTGGSSWQRL